LNVPNLVGRTEEEARALLSDAGFAVSVSYQVDDTVSPGTVLSQTPLPDSQAASGSTVTLVVSSLTPDPTQS
jgi:beta-lactam-binding protein with PASTA domain